jgi:hypothetical protein
VTHGPRRMQGPPKIPAVFRGNFRSAIAPRGETPSLLRALPRANPHRVHEHSERGVIERE